MNIFDKIPVNYDVSLAFIVFIIGILTVYMAYRCFRRINAPTVICFALQLCMLTTGVLTVINRVLAVPVFEIVMIVFGILMPSAFLMADYISMKKRIKKTNSDVPLVEKLERQNHKTWRYNEYIENPDEWMAEISAGAVVKTLELTDKHLKTNVTHQLGAVHKLIEEGEYKQALDSYTIIAGLLGDIPQIIYNIAWLSYKNGLIEDAVKYYKKALYIIDGAGAEQREKKGKKAGKSTASEEVESIRPAIHFGYGLCLYAQEKYELAVNQFDLAQKAANGIREADINIARCYIATGVLKEAKEHIRTALKTKEDNKLRYLLARLCFENNEEMECKHHLDTIVVSEPDFTEAWALMGKLCRKRADWANAVVAYKNLTRLSPQDADAHYRLGTSLRHEGKTEEALSSLKFATELMPEHSRALYSMASIYDAEGKTDKAIECLERSLEGNERLEMAYSLLAEIYISNDKVKEAINVYEESIREYPESYVLHYNLGISLMMMKRYEEAVRVFKRAHKLTSDDPSLYYNWASAVISLKNYTEAARLYKEGLKLKSDDDEILFGLARVSALSGDVEAVIGFLKQAFEINPGLRIRAKASHDFAAYRTHPEFMEITRLPVKEEKKEA